VSLGYESRDRNGSHSGKPDSALAIYGSRDIISSPLKKGDSTLAVYDPQIPALRKEIKDLESALAEKESLIENLESILREKKKFIDHMEKDFRDVTKSAFLKEMRLKDIEAKEGAYQMKMKEKEQELRALLHRIEKAQSDSAMKDARIKELHSFVEAARSENQQLKVLKSQEEEKRKLDLVTIEQLNTKLAELTIASGQSESKKLQLTNQVKELMKRTQDLKQQAAAQEAKLVAKDLELQSVRDQLREEKEKSSKLVEELEQKHIQMEDLIQFVEELEEQSKALQAQVSTKDTSAQTDGQEQLKEKCAALEEQVESHELVTQNLRARLREEWETTSKLSEKLQQCDVQIDDLKHQLQEFKTSQNSETIGKSLSLAPQATPHLLDRSVQRVHEGAGIFSRLLMKAMEQGKIDGMAVARNNFVRSVSLDRGAPLKYVLEAITCKLLFHGFEHECFDLQDSTSGFLDVEQQRMDNFRQYKYLLSVEDTQELVHTGDSLFADFCRIKLEDLSDTIPEIASMVKEITELTFDRPASPVDSDNELTAKLGSTFIQLAVCVWQVHKLAFAFNPVARIFRVSQSEKFVEKYMESVIFQESESDDDEHLSSSDISRVDFMVVPGFLINKFVVRSRVFVVTKPLTSSVRLPSIRT
jgi:chromosome segregation ATPase